jgi:hypothetical protein
MLAFVMVAGQAGEPLDSAALTRIRDEGLKRSQVDTLFGALVDGIGPRLAGSPEYLRAAEWGKSRMAEFGLVNARLEPFEFTRGWTLDKFTIEMVEPRYMPLLGYPEAWSPSTTGEVVAPIVILAGKTAEQVAAMPLKGAAVLQAAAVTNFITTDRVQPARAEPAPAAPPAPAAANPGRGRQGAAGGPTVNQAIQAGGVAVLLKPSRGIHGTVFVQAGRDTPGDTVPKVVLAGEHYNMLMRMTQQGIAVKIRVNVQARFLDQDKRSYNVLGELPGTDPVMRDQVVMLGAHLDSWHTATGATDNADAVAASLEALRILKATGLPLKRTIRLALWGAEEEGLLGSKAWVAQHLQGDANAKARANLSVYFNIDPGKGPIYGWYLENNEAIKPIFDAWMAPFADLGALKNVMAGIGNTDHLSFIAAGVPGFNPIQDYVGYDVREHHTNVDLAERINPADLRQNAVILASFLYHAANRADRIPSAVRK